MKRSIMFGVLFLTALAVAASAQSTGGQTPSQSGSSDQVTVTGCLRRGDAGSTGAGATGAAGSGGSLVDFESCRAVASAKNLVTASATVASPA